MLRSLRNIARSSRKLNLMVICQTVLLLAVTLAVMLYFSRQTLKEEAIQDAEETLAADPELTSPEGRRLDAELRTRFNRTQHWGLIS